MIKRNFAFVLLLIFFSSCGRDGKDMRLVSIGISSDIQSASPVYSFGVSESILFEHTNLGLVGHKWDSTKGGLTDYPLLAKDWKWNDSRDEVVFTLRSDIKWSDGKAFSPEDIVFTYSVYSNPVVQSSFFGMFDKFHTLENGQIDIKNTFEIISPQKIKFKFLKNSNSSLLETDLPIIAKHIFEGIPDSLISVSDAIFKSCGTGPYKLKKWERNQYILLEKRKGHFLENDLSPSRIILKVIPEYFTRKNQLLTGEIDVLPEINTEDIYEFENRKDLNISAMQGRYIDFICWNNVSPEAFLKNSVKPNKYFGGKEIRKALTYAINRKMILDEFLLGKGSVANEPVSPIFKDYYSKSNNFSYDPKKALAILKNAGWHDSDKNGILDKNGQEFSFTLNFVTGKPLREYTANIVKSDLKKIGINVNLEPLERGVFLEKMYSRQMDAFISGWQVPIPLHIKPYWYSDLKKYQTNTSGFMNKEIDQLLDKTSQTNDPAELKRIYNKIQDLIRENQPVTFLFWIDNFSVYSSKIKNAEVNSLGSVQRCWEWEVR